jgi:L-asparaginase II
MLNRFAEVTRGGQLESCHAGALVIATAAGDILGVAGANGKEVFPRSSIKLIQALPLIETGAADRYAMGDAELALACASHVGSPRHIAIVSQLLERAGLAAGKLACGPQFPLDIDDQRALLKSGLQATALHNNCSGKHAAMLLTARHLGEPIEHYELAQHPVQERIRQTIEEVVGARLDDAIPGIDGCSVPTWRLPLDRLAIAFARLLCGEGLADPRLRAVDRLLSACWAQPELMAGRGRFDTEILTRFPQDVFIKAGAEGVYCGAIRSRRIGFAVKIADGAKRAAEAVVGAILAHFLPEADDLGQPVILHNAAGIAVGDVRPGRAVQTVLDGITL